MANNNFVIQNGLTVGPLTIDAATGSITTTGSINAIVQASTETVTSLTANTVTANTLVGGTGLGNITVTGNVLPSANVTYDLGSKAMQWHSVYVGPGTLYINGTPVLSSSTSGTPTINITASPGQNMSVQTSGGGIIQFNGNTDGSGGYVQVGSTMQIVAGNQITSSDGNPVKLANGIATNTLQTRDTNTNLNISASGTGIIAVNSDMTITGNFTVNGTTETINTSNLYVTDQYIQLNNGVTGTPSLDAGLRITRGNQNNAVFKWKESVQAWQISNDNVTYGNIATETYVGNQFPTVSNPGTFGNTTTIPVITVNSKGLITTLSTATISGALTFTGDVTGTGSTGSSTALTLANSGATAGTYGSATQIPQVVVNAKGLVTSISNVAVSTTISLAGTSGTGSVSGGGTLTFAGSNGVTASASGSTITLNTPQNLQTSATPTFAGLTNTGNQTISGTLGVTGATTLTTATASGIQATAIGNVTPGTGAFTTLTNSGVHTSNGNLVANSGTASTSTTTGALVVNGGAGISGALYVGGSLNVAGTLTYINTTTEVVTGVEVVAGNLVANSGTASSSTSTGALVVVGGVGISGAINAGSIQGTPIGSSSASTGAFTTLSSSGASTLNSLTVTNGTTASGTLTVSGAAQINNTLGVTGTSTLAGVNAGALTATSINSTPIGATTPSTGAFTSLSASSTLSITGAATLSSTLSVSGASTLTGQVTTGGSIVPSNNNTQNIGSSSYNYATVYATTFSGVSTTAKYADLAENYQGDRNYAPGTVVMFGGTAEVTVADADTTAVAGVVSTNPAHLMNGGLTGNGVVPVALQGRVPCMVIGPVKKGDMLVSAGFGYAKSSTDPKVGQVIGKALYDFPGSTKAVIEVVVGRI